MGLNETFAVQPRSSKKMYYLRSFALTWVCNMQAFLPYRDEQEDDQVKGEVGEKICFWHLIIIVNLPASVAAIKQLRFS